MLHLWWEKKTTLELTKYSVVTLYSLDRFIKAWLDFSGRRARKVVSWANCLMINRTEFRKASFADSGIERPPEPFMPANTLVFQIYVYVTWIAMQNQIISRAKRQQQHQQQKSHIHHIILINGKSKSNYSTAHYMDARIIYLLMCEQCSTDACEWQTKCRIRLIRDKRQKITHKKSYY